MRKLTNILFEGSGRRVDDLYASSYKDIGKDKGVNVSTERVKQIFREIMRKFAEERLRAENKETSFLAIDHLSKSKEFIKSVIKLLEDIYDE